MRKGRWRKLECRDDCEERILQGSKSVERQIHETGGEGNSMTIRMVTGTKGADK